MTTLYVPSNGVNAPGPASFVPPAIDTAALANIPNDYFAGQQAQHALDVQNAFRGAPGSPNGIPTVDGTPNGPIDVQAMYRKLMSFGAYDQANQILQTGIAQQGMKNTNDFNSFLRTGQMPAESAAPASQPSANTPAVQNSPASPPDFYTANRGAEGNVTDPKFSNGTAGGVTQITQDTWDTVRAEHPELRLPPVVTDATADQQLQAEKAITYHNTGWLAQNGIPVNDRNARITYFFGAHGGVKFLDELSKNPSAPAAQMFPAEAANNPGVFYNVDPATGKPGPGGGSKTLLDVMRSQTAGFGNGNTTGFNPPVAARNQVAGPGAPSQFGGPTAHAADGTPVATNAQGQAIDPRTGQPTQPVAPAYNGPAPHLAAALAAQAAAHGGTAPGGAAMPTGGAAAAAAAENAARIAASPAVSNGAIPPLPATRALQASAYAAGLVPAASAPAQGDESAPAPQYSSYAENLAKPPPSNTVARAPGGAAAPAPNQSVAPPQNAAASPSLTAGSPVDPTLGGAVPKPFADGLIARGVDPSQIPGTWARYLTSMASSPGISKESAETYRAAAQQVMETLRQANVPNPALKEYLATRQIDSSTGQPETQAAWKARTAGAVAAAEQQARNENTLVETQPVPGGPKQYDTAAHLIRAINNGTAGANSSVGVGAGSPPGGGGLPANLPVAEQPAVIAAKQAAVAKDEEQMMPQYQNRQIAKERLGELADLTEKYQTGNLAGAYAEAQGLARSLGIPLANTNQMNAAAYQEFTKNAIANVFSNAKDLGGRILVQEIQGLTKANANAELQPEAAAKIIAQGAGILNFEDQHTKAYFDWKHQKNPDGSTPNANPYDTSPFEVRWLSDHPVKQYTKQAEQQIAPLGAPLPPPPQREVGQVYQSPNGHGIGRWTGVPGREWQLEARPASQRLFQPVTVTP